MATNISLKRFHQHVDAGRIIFSDNIMEARFEDSKNEPHRKVLWTDASFANRKTGPAVGIAIVWKQDFTEELQKQADPGEQEWVEDYRASSLSMSSGSGEQEAAFDALEKGELLFAPGMTGDILVYTDAEIEGFRSPDSRGGWLNPAGNFATRAAIRAVHLAEKGFTVEFKACAGHGGILGNELVDYWARQAINLDVPRNSDLGSWLRAKRAAEDRDKRRTTLTELARQARDREEQARVDAANARWNQTAGTTTAAERTQEEIDADYAEFEQWLAQDE
ncbi:hypothetical protein DBV05_g1433 [Lasiodiplodia theobromae]|uniref:RNase H type-1 domain-containing protein n=1 Tax=Lasiodiplodia theobromae TaxID=45133 RepID=A0A5N5DPG0_9PEZI|nr:hypothetical protein DBV05_g1433 [Lasiodiplodia theobromae]